MRANARKKRPVQESKEAWPLGTFQQSHCMLESSTEWESLLEKYLILTNQQETYKKGPSPPSKKG
jgi:hypothetical protein